MAVDNHKWAGSPCQGEPWALPCPQLRLSFGNIMVCARIVYSFDPPIARVVLGDPDRSNAPDAVMASDLRSAAERVSEDGAAVLVVSGAGREFCVGRAELGESPVEDPRQWLDMHRCAATLAGIPVPVIAAINGDAVDQGLEIALACDLRVAAEDARFGITDLARGVVPWDGGTQRLPRLVGRGLALEMLLAGRVLDAQEALEAGLVHQVAPRGELEAAVERLASTLAGNAPIAQRYAKEAVIKGADGTMEQGLRLEADLNILLQGTADRAEGIASFIEKRSPRFAGR